MPADLPPEAAPPAPAGATTEERAAEAMPVVVEPPAGEEPAPKGAETARLETKQPKPPRAAWKNLEPTDPSDPVPHRDERALAGAAGWVVAGASRRGKMHANVGTYREDAFEIRVAGAWHVVSVSDGAGSASLSRVGSGLIVRTAVESVCAFLESRPTPSADELGTALEQAMAASHAAVHSEAQRRSIPVKDLSGTFLLLAHAALDDAHVVGVYQVGDGLIAVQYEDGECQPLADKDSGAFGGETYFLTSRPAERWLGRSLVRRLEKAPRLLVAMTDGVADDLLPYEVYLPRLFSSLDAALSLAAPGDPADAAHRIQDLIGYEQRGSFDDRTLVALFREKRR